MCPAGLVYWGKGLTINDLRYSGSCPFPQTPIPLRFFEVPCGTCLLGEGVNNQRLTLQRIMSLPPNPHPVEVFRGAQHWVADPWGGT